MEPPQPADRGAHSHRSSPRASRERRIIETLLEGRANLTTWLVVDAGLHDCAVLADGLVLTADTLVEGVHFAASSPSRDVGWKAVAVSVSDLGAARAAPMWMVLAVSLPEQAVGWVDGFAAGMQQASRDFGVHLVGGDVTRMVSGGPITITCTLGGRCVDVPRTRAGASAGDDLWVTGTLGLAARAFARPDPPVEATAALLHPEVPLAFALALDVATAAMDLSDGLVTDLPRLCLASGVGATVVAGAVPCGKDPDGLMLALAGGDDYALLFTAHPSAREAIATLGAAHGVRTTRIGLMTADPSVRLDEGSWPEPLFSHFPGEAP